MNFNASNDEIDRIIESISKDLDAWDGKTDIVDFLAEILKKRAFLTEEEAKRDAEQIIEGIVRYKKSKELIGNNPELVEAIWKNAEPGLKQKLSETFKDILAKAKTLIENFKKA